MEAHPVHAVQAALKEHVGSRYLSYRYLIAVSGGADSMALWDVMTQLLPVTSLTIAHFNHRLRKKASDRDEALVRKQAQELKVQFISGRGLGKARSEEALRKERLQFLQESAKAWECDFILTAHHADDQLETILMRMIRGTGLEGLRGMAVKRGKWLKPLLSVDRDSLRDFVKARKLSFREDHTNQQTHYFRNDLRKNVLPKLYAASRRHGGKVKFLKRISAMTQELQHVSSTLDKLTTKRLNQMTIHTPLWTRLEMSGFLRLSFPVQCRLLRKLLSPLQEVGLSLTRAETTALCQQIALGKGCHVPGNIQMSVSCGYLFFQNRKQRALTKIEDLTLDGEHLLCPSLGIEITIEPKLARRVKSRFFSPGDRQGSRKLKRLFLEHRIPFMERKILPLLVDKLTGETLWFFPQECSGISVKKVKFPYSFVNPGANSI